jgi:hypothetical protein
MKSSVVNFIYLIFGHDVDRVAYELSKDLDFIREAPNFKELFES